MKKILLIYVLSVFPFHFAKAYNESESFVNPSQKFRLMLTPPELEPQPQPQTLTELPPVEVVPDAVPSSRALLYENSFLLEGRDYVEYLKVRPNDDFATLDADKKSICERRYNTVLNDRKIDIRLAFGYFDWSDETEIYYEGQNFGHSPSADLGGYRAMEKFLLQPCEGNLQVCAFTKVQGADGLYTKTVKIRGQSYAVELRMSQPSLTEFYKVNLARQPEQKAKSEATRSFYMQALEDADLAIYLGHSRNGGGPDFYPPKLLPTGHPDYDGYYIPNKAGVKMMLQALTSSGHQAPMMALMSCDSRNHFYNKIHDASSRTGVISSTQVTTINLLFAATLGGIDSLLRGQCQKSFYQSLRLYPGNQDVITMDNMFD